MHQCVHMTFDLCVVVCQLKKRHTLELCSVHVVSRVKKCEIQKKNMNENYKFNAGNTSSVCKYLVPITSVSYTHLTLPTIYSV